MTNHVSTLLIQAREFESDKNSSSKRTLQIDYAMSCQCEYQNDLQSAL